VGLGMVGIGIFVVHRSLISKSKLLSENIVEIQKAYESVMTMMKRRADEMDLRFEDEKKFRALYLSIAEDAESHKTKIKALKEDELLIIQNRMYSMVEKSQELEEDLERMIVENRKLKLELIKLRDEYEELKVKYDNLVAQNIIGKPSIKM
jgi:hypothetical protein